ncbi:ABC transporter permease [uncultured Mucilaginibacter sp.]|uniref:ABC transporter permease n=1 Tax=uncultured Mucilaginibacter sp. TaxID=797541 RepID=UPI00261621CB|nr:ABC transporter permease [uncultured Mucilaginibacter sp.]
MFKNYIKIALRRLQKSKLFTLINVVGLTAGLVSCLLISLFVINELSYDRFNKKADRIVRMTMQYGDGGAQKVALTGTKAGPQLSRTFPQIQDYVRLMNSEAIVKNGQEVFHEKNFLFADPSIFNIFSFKLIRGNPKTALNAPNEVVITAKTAKKYFNGIDPIGKTINVAIGKDKDYTITGVVADAPENSQVKYDFIASFTSLKAAASEEWWTANYTTYLLLKNKDELKGFQRQLNAYMFGISKNELKLENNSPLLYNLEPLLSVHLYSQLDGLEPSGSITTVYILGIIALLILMIACINYTNLATVQSSARSAEIGIRKVLGAEKLQLFKQFIGESFLLTLLSLVIALILAAILLPYFNQLTGKLLSFSLIMKPVPLITMVILFIVIAFASGAYPAFILSNTKIVHILKSGLRLSSSGGTLRKSLIVFQFAVSVFLIVATIIILQQLNYIQSKDLGYDKEHILVLPITQQVRQNYEPIKAEISRLPQVISVSGANATPTFVRWGDGISTETGHGKVSLDITALPSDLDFIKTMGMKIIAGTDFTRADLKLTDTTNQSKNFKYTFILNETAVKAFGWTPEQAIGKVVDKNAPGVVKAVVKDFHFSSFHQPIGPLMLFLDRNYTNDFFVRVSGKNLPATLHSLQNLWKQRVPSMPFEYRFLDDEYNSLYVSEQRSAKVFSTFSILAILLACLGLFGLVAFTTMQRTKEIGIRKVLGAGVSGIVALIAKDFLKLTLIAVLVASPLAWYFMHEWLQGFAYRIAIKWWVFSVAGGLAILIALLTISFQAIKAALANPVKSLRSE